jgi:hypothetical protein
MPTIEHHYNAEISAGSLMLRESRKIATLLLAGADEEAWHNAIYVDNILQKNVPSTARRMVRLIRNRLGMMTPDLWGMVVRGASEVAVQSLMAAAIKHSRLLGDFLIDVVKEHRKVFDRQLSVKDWTSFLSVCEHRDPAVSGWSDTTKAKLGQVVFRVLAEAHYLDSTRSLKIIPVSLAPQIREYLENHKEEYVLKCMDISNG